MRSTAVIGILLGLGWTVVLGFVSLTDGGTLTSDWIERVPWVLFAAFPAVLAIIGLRGSPEALFTAAIISIPLALMSLAGATLPLLIPACFYFAASWMGTDVDA
jgi:hypothetical protein